MKFRKLFSIGILGALAFLSACSSQNSVDLIVFNAQVYTVDEAFSKQEAFAIKDGKFVAIGSSEEILKNYKAQETLDAEGKAVYPGFYDAHAHFLGYALSLGQADLMGSHSIEEVLNRLATFRNEFPDAPWLLGRGWDQNLWPIKSFPTKEQLDEVFPDIPVYIVRVDGHAAVVNSKALEMAKITGSRPIEGGSIEVKNGKPTGILIDNAMSIVRDLIPEPTQEEVIAYLKKAEALCAEVGLTTVSDAGLDRGDLEFLESLYDQGEIKLRNHAMINVSQENLDYYLEKGPLVKQKFTAHTFKILADGALGSRGACLLEPYSDAATLGFLLYDPNEIDQSIARIIDSKFQVSAHAIGDSTNRFLLNTYGKYLKGKNDRRWRIEHAQILAPGDLEKFGQFSILPSVQPTHATSDMFWAIDRIGQERMKLAYAFKPLLDQVGVLPLGSDFPVEHINPIYGFHAAVARVDYNNLPAGGFQMEHALTREEALKGMTIWAAYSFFEENERGSIEKGKAADFVLLNQDIMEVPNEYLRGTQILRTVVDGETIFKR